MFLKLHTSRHTNSRQVQVGFRDPRAVFPNPPTPIPGSYRIGIPTTTNPDRHCAKGQAELELDGKPAEFR